MKTESKQLNILELGNSYIEKKREVEIALHAMNTNNELLLMGKKVEELHEQANKHPVFRNYEAVSKELKVIKDLIEVEILAGQELKTQGFNFKKTTAGKVTRVDVPKVKELEEHLTDGSWILTKKDGEVISWDLFKTAATKPRFSIKEPKAPKADDGTSLPEAMVPNN